MSSSTPAPVPAVTPGSDCPACGKPVQVGDRYCTWCGAPQTAGAAVAVPAGAPRRPTGWRGRKGWIAGGVAAALVVVATISYGAVRTREVLVGADPAGVVRAYFQALADRDPDRAGAMLAPGTNPAAGVTADHSEQEMLVASALHNAGYTPPARVQARVLRSQGGRATVAAQYDLPVGHQEMQLQLIREGDTGPGWEIANGAPHMALPSFGGLRNINLLVLGVQISGERPALRLVFPGAYQVSLLPNPLNEATPVTVWPGSTAAASFTLRPRQGLQALVETQVRAYLDNCADLQAAHSTWCPVDQSTVTGAADIQWRITQYPTVNLELSPFGDVDMARAAGRAVATGHLNTTGRAPFTHEVTFQLGGHIFTNAGAAVLFPTP
jgi:hypothetical protein